jgi:adenosine deaminase
MDYKKYAIVDLHLHLDGSLSAKAIIKVAKKEGIILPSYNEEELNKYLMVPDNCGSLNEYLERFSLPNLVLQTEYGLETCTLDLLERLKKDGLKYVEIRMAPQLSTNKGLTQRKVVKILVKTLKIAEKTGIFSNLILCMMRGENTKKQNIETIKVANDFLGKGIVAMDLAGAEGLFPNEMFEEEFSLINKLGIPLTVHSGEASGASSVASALKFGACRIGHGIKSIEDDSVINELIRRKITLEVCPKSNLDTKTISKYEDLPLKEFIKKGVKISINTDDMTVSNTTLKQEYETLVKLGFSEQNLREFAINSINCSFASDDVKRYLLSLI